MGEVKEIVNRVDQSGIITLDLEQLIPNTEIIELDIKGQLFQELILKEKDFRLWVKENDWAIYRGKVVAVLCSVDAIIPTWAFMLVAKALSDFTENVFFANKAEATKLFTERVLSSISGQDYQDKRVVIKGCGDRFIDNHAFVKLTTTLVPFVKSLMFGEPCSTVPVFKKRK